MTAKNMLFSPRPGSIGSHAFNEECRKTSDWPVIAYDKTGVPLLGIGGNLVLIAPLWYQQAQFRGEIPY